MRRILRTFDRGVQRLFAAADALMNRLYGWRFNPLYQSGTLTAALMVALIVSGLYLLLYYRIGAPYASVARLTDQVWVGRWIRAFHRYAADAAVVAALLHALRMFAQGRRWGARALAWTSGLVLFFLVLVCGWTGYVMVWDTFGESLAVEGARLLDLLPIFSEPISRAFVGEHPLPAAFFFLNLFLHIALPIGLGIVLWVHVSRLARPVLFPPRRLTTSVMVLLVAVSIAWPMPMTPEASAFRLPERTALDLAYAFWLPASRALPAWVAWLAGAAVALVALLVPWWSRPAAEAPSVVDERFCTGCTQCALDCPFEAIAMLPRTDGRAPLVAHVTPDRCVSCGICAGSCAPMAVGPPRRTGRDQVAELRALLTARPPGPREVVVVACRHGAGGVADAPPTDGVVVVPVACAGDVHTSVIEFLIRAGAAGVLVAACPPRDCWHREGPIWLEQRVYHDREAELQQRVDRRRVSLATLGEGESGAARAAIAEFRDRVLALERPGAESAIEISDICDEPDPDQVAKVMS